LTLCAPSTAVLLLVYFDTPCPSTRDQSQIFLCVLRFVKRHPAPTLQPAPTLLPSSTLFPAPTRCIRLPASIQLLPALMFLFLASTIYLCFLCSHRGRTTSSSMLPGLFALSTRPFHIFLSYLLAKFSVVVVETVFLSPGEGSVTTPLNYCDCTETLNTHTSINHTYRSVRSRDTIADSTRLLNSYRPDNQSERHKWQLVAYVVDFDNH
jgi:hypothetical protein